MLRFRPVPVGTGSTGSCRLCGAVEAPHFSDTQTIVSEIQRVAGSWAGGPGPNVLLCGPEPFGHSGLPDMIGAAAGAGVERLGILTTAEALGQDDNARGAVAAGVRYLEAILLGSTAEEQDRLSGSAGSFDAAMTGMRAFKAAAEDAGDRVSLVGRVNVCPHTLKSLPEITLAFAKAGAVAVRFVVSKDLSPARLEWLFAALDTAVVSRMWGWVDGIDAQMLGDRALHAQAAALIEEVAAG